MTDGSVTVVAPIEDSPAEGAGILAGDVVVSVDEIEINADDIDTAVSRMRGALGTEVTVGVRREGEPDALSFALTRSMIHVTTVRGRYLGSGVGYLKISGFSDSTGEDLAAAIDNMNALADGPLTGVVVDLRNNPGGVLGRGCHRRRRIPRRRFDRARQRPGGRCAIRAPRNSR